MSARGHGANGAAELPEWACRESQDLDVQLREVEAVRRGDDGPAERPHRDALPPPPPVPDVLPVLPSAYGPGWGRGVADTQPTGAPVMPLSGVTDSLNEHDDRLDQIESWIESASTLAKQGKWLIGILVSALIGLGTWGVSTTIRLEERSAVALERLVDLDERGRERSRELAMVKETLIRIEARDLLRRERAEVEVEVEAAAPPAQREPQR